MTKFYMPCVKVEVRTTLCVAWIDDQIERRLAAKVHAYRKYGHVQVLEHKQPVAHIVAPPHEATCSHSDDPIEVLHVPRTF
ncbi:hypothetical protein CK203_042522 [Vitis vinifera]|uniref:Uncharacterized protein n=1 Tax=Vitis vinifera TaxID=29760 RepID=A0A438HEV3_VITVI|nr:hypothetical protein CK203_042522 [Vitis vinifera]